MIHRRSHWTAGALAALAVAAGAWSSVARGAPAAGDELDPSFGTGGRATLALVGGLAANAVAIDPAGRIVTAGGYAPNGNPFDGLIWVVARHLASGQPDTAFFGNGYRVHGTYRCSNDDCSLTGPARAVLPLPDGRVVVGGDDGNSYLIARYLEGGALDPTFGEGGWVDGPFESDATTLVRGLAAGPGDSVFVLVDRLARTGRAATFSILRLTSTGEPDGGFGDNGWHHELFAPVVARALLRLPSGRLLVAGYNDYGDSPGSSAQCVVAKYWANGAARDNSFGQSGLALFHFDQTGQFDTCLAMALQADGKVVVTGENNEHLGVGRLLADGTLDDTFNTDGRLVVPAAGDQASQGGFGVAADRLNRTLVAGAQYSGGGTSAILMLRLLPSGDLDPSFGSAGLVTTTFGTALRNEAYGLALQPDGRAVAAGYAQPPDLSARLALVRYLNEVEAASPTPSTTATAMATATVTATASPTATLTASPSPTVTPSPTTTPSPTATPTATAAGYTVRGRVRLERRGSNAGATVCVLASCATTDAAGAYQLTSTVRRAGLALVATHPSYLRSERPFEAPAEGATVDAPPLTLLSGDLNQDGKVEVDDATMVGQRFNLRYDPTRPGPPWLDACDITDDDVIDIRDMVGVQFNLLKTAPSPWP